MNTILVVDDEPLSIKYFSLFLKDAFNVYCANNYDEALKILEDIQTIDCIISDFLLKDSPNGIQLLRECKERYPEIKRVMITGLYDEFIMDAEKKGIIEAMYEKPIEFEELIPSLKALIN